MGAGDAIGLDSVPVPQATLIIKKCGHTWQQLPDLQTDL